jgi:hypothetical protein
LQLNAIRAKLLEEVAHSSEGYPMPALFPRALFPRG